MREKYHTIAGLSILAALCAFIFYYGYKIYSPRYKKSPSPVTAQERGFPSPPVHKGLSIKELKDTLMLTDHQIKLLEPIMKQEKTRRKAILNRYSSAGASVREKADKELQDFRKYYEDMYSHILTDEQFKKYLQIQDAVVQE